MSKTRYNLEFMDPSFAPWAPSKDASRQIAVMMSGGVDSSVTAGLLKDAGWDVLGITMKIPVSCDMATRGCCGADAAFVCHELGIPHYFIDVGDSFNELIIDRFRQEYAQGHTPNPCVDCNTLLKFSIVWDCIEEHFGIRQAATGHYARVVTTPHGARLQRAADKSKDQSYFLYGITAKRLSDLLLPLGDMTKPEIRSIAEQLNLSVAEKPESMELCFAGQADYRKALADSQVNQPGDLTDMQGNKIGDHKGISNYTIGQRRGLGFAGGKPLYVGIIDAKTNTVALGTRDEVTSNIIKADEINILIPEEFETGTNLFAKIRSGGDPHPCKIIECETAAVTVEFDQPQFAPSPGQKLVLYNSDDYIVAGGTIIQD